MKQNNYSNFGINNNLKAILSQKNLSPQKLSYFTELSESTIKSMVENPNKNITELTIQKICETLHVSHDNLIQWIPNQDYWTSDSNGFTEDNLHILEKEMQKINLHPKYYVYARNRTMTISLPNAGNRRLNFNGNFRINTFGLRELSLIDFDVTSNKTDVTSKEKLNFFRDILRCVLIFAKKAKIYQINYQLHSAETVYKPTIQSQEFKYSLHPPPSPYLNIAYNLGFINSQQQNDLPSVNLVKTF
ncbi:MAG: helix-turn-helix transcriptional regulator [Lentilactobacillus diolivorans]|uniref:helix-turn-helix domain-containing protein n=3 Tax=Lentilactobacillus diolivorans TaxID=179838 RepID=UPI0039E9DC00